MSTHQCRFCRALWSPDKQPGSKLGTERVRPRAFQAPRETLERTTSDWSRAEDGVLISGAGIAGLATAAALHKVGIPAIVLEREVAPRLEGSAIGLWPNAFRALDALGVAEPLRDAHPLLQRVQLCTPKGETLRSFHLEECKGAPHEFRGVLRSSLLQTLQSSLPSGTVRFGCPIVNVQEDSSGPFVTLENGRSVKARIVLGADGARSSIAAALDLAKPSYAGYSAYRGVATFDGPLPIAMDTVRQILGRGIRAGMYPLSHKSLYWFVAMTCPAESSPSETEYKEDALKLVNGWQSGIVEAIQQTPSENISRNRITDRWLLPTKPFGRGCITLAGDSAHPMTPNLGQGGCTALEDAVVLGQTLRDAAASASGRSLRGLPSTAISSALREYEKKRSLRVTKITVRSNLMGQILGSNLPPVCAGRDFVIRKLLPVGSFMDHTLFDCGSL